MSDQIPQEGNMILCPVNESIYDENGRCTSCDRFNANAENDVWFCPTCGEYTVNFPDPEEMQFEGVEKWS